MSDFDFVFMADCQIGAYAAFSGVTAAEAARFAEIGMRVEPVPKVEGFEWDADRYRRAITAANRLRPRFVVMGGDMIDEQESQAQYDALMSITSELDDDIPMYWVPGNHDIAPDALVPTPASIALYRDAFGPDHYAFEVGHIRFIVLNTTVIDQPDAAGDALDEQFEFLGKEIDRLLEDDKSGVVFGHHPLFVADPDEENTYWNLPIDRRRLLLGEFHRGRIRQAFAGHWHRNSIARDGEFEMVTSGPVGYPLGADPSGIRVVEVAGTRIVHRYHSLEELTHT